MTDLAWVDALARLTSVLVGHETSYTVHSTHQLRALTCSHNSVYLCRDQRSLNMTTSPSTLQN